MAVYLSVSMELGADEVGASSEEVGPGAVGSVRAFELLDLVGPGAVSPDESQLAQRSPPRSKWALKKFTEPDVAIAAEAEISSASVAAATICAKR